MNITLEQARTLEAFARHGTLQGAARALRKAHSAVLYALKQLEAQTELKLFDRSGYRTRLTPAGQEVLRHCRTLLEAEAALEVACQELRSGWEPELKVVFDAIVPLGPVLEVAKAVRQAQARTRVELAVDALGGVEERFEREEAQVMVTLLPPKRPGLVLLPLPTLKARLVASRRHPLARQAGALTRDQLQEHVLLTVRGSDPRLQLSTAGLDELSTVHLADFHAKKAAILEGIGFGWLPDWLIRRELKKGALVLLELPQGSTHAFQPRLAHRPSPGPAARLCIEQLAGARARLHFRA